MTIGQAEKKAGLFFIKMTYRVHGYEAASSPSYPCRQGMRKVSRPPLIRLIPYPAATAPSGHLARNVWVPQPTAAHSALHPESGARLPRLVGPLDGWGVWSSIYGNPSNPPCY